MLDPTLPEKQRARRRLIGAIALVLAAVVILPMVLDSHPKPATDGIAIEIPAHDDAPAPGATASSASTAAFDADDEGAASTPSTAGVAAPAQANSAVTLGTGTHTAAANGPSTSLNTAGKTPSSGKAATTPSPSTATAANANAANANAATSNDGAAGATGSGAGAGAGTTTAKAPTANDAPPAGSHFVVQIGSFASEAPAQAWVVKLKAAGVPAYVQHARQDDGSDRVLVRAISKRSCSRALMCVWRGA
jgi:DedD protein